MTKTPLAPIRVLIAEDLPFLREGLRCLLRGEEGIGVVGAVANGEEVIEQIHQTQPDLLLLDLDLPELYWRMVLGYLTTHALSTNVLMLTSTAEEDKALRALQAGAKGVLAKAATPEELIKAIRLVAAGEIWTSRKLLPRLVEELTRLPLPVTLNGRRFTNQEQKILHLLSQGLSNKEIAKRLAIGDGTVKSHVNHIFRKTGLHTRLQLSLLTKSSVVTYLSLDRS